MCVVSMVMDHYEPIIPKIEPLQPQPLTQFVWPLPSPEIEQLRALIAEFKEALAAAKTVDRLTGQPDCEDPEKAKLEARVWELEQRIFALEKVTAKKSRRRRKKKVP